MFLSLVSIFTNDSRGFQGCFHGYSDANFFYVITVSGSIEGV